MQHGQPDVIAVILPLPDERLSAARSGNPPSFLVEIVTVMTPLARSVVASPGGRRTVDVDARLWASGRPLAYARICGDTRGRNGSIREEPGAGVNEKAPPAGESGGGAE